MIKFLNSGVLFLIVLGVLIYTMSTRVEQDTENHVTRWSSESSTDPELSSLTLSGNFSVEVRNGEIGKDLWIGDQLALTEDLIKIEAALPSQRQAQAAVISSQCGGSGCGIKDYFILSLDTTGRTVLNRIPTDIRDIDSVEVDFTEDGERFHMDIFVADPHGQIPAQRFSFSSGSVFMSASSPEGSKPSKAIDEN